MGFFDIANSPLLYILVIVGLLLVAAYCIILLRKAKLRCRELQIEPAIMKKITRSTLVYTIVPSLSIVVGLVTMAAALGVALPWWRLSVLGSLGYEMSAASMTALFMGYSSLGTMAAANNPSDFVAIFFVMSAGLLIPLIILIVSGKKLSTGLAKARKSSDKKKSDWSVILGKVILMTLMASFIPMMIFIDTVYGLTFLLSMALAVLMNYLVKKRRVRWLDNFSLSITMIVSMVASVFLYNWLG